MGKRSSAPGQFPVDAADRSLRRTSKNASPVGGLAVGVRMPFLALPSRALEMNGKHSTVSQLGARWGASVYCCGASDRHHRAGEPSLHGQPCPPAPSRKACETRTPQCRGKAFRWPRERGPHFLSYRGYMHCLNIAFYCHLNAEHCSER